MRSLKLVTGYSCNNSCSFCCDREYRGKIADKTYAAVLAELIEARRRGAAAADIQGGEATLRPDIFRILAAAKRLGYVHLMITTNGSRFADKAFVKKLVAAGVTEVRFSLHGATARVHDGLTGLPGSYGRILRGVANLRALHFGEVSVNTTLVKANFRGLARLRALLKRLKVFKWNIIYVGETGGGAGNVPRVSEAAPGILDCLRDPGLEATLINAPVPCFFWEETGQVEMFERTARQYVRGDGPVPFRGKDLRKRPARRKIPACAACDMRGRCDGVYVSYLREYGPGELRAAGLYGDKK